MNEIQKSQNIRLVDVFLLGPFMIWFGTKSKLPEWSKFVMIISGIYTIFYNANNFIENYLERDEL